jgi:hypothetical protein
MAEDRLWIRKGNAMKKIMILAFAVALGAFVLSASATCGSCGGGKDKKAGGCCGSTNTTEQTQGGAAK